MAKKALSSGFTLIEVLVSVMIIATVIGALLQLFANNTHLIRSVEKRVGSTLLGTLLAGEKVSVVKTEGCTMVSFVEGFDLDDDVRQELKRIHVRMEYRSQDVYEDMSPHLSGTSETRLDAVGVETGRTMLTVGDATMPFARIRLP